MTLRQEKVSELIRRIAAEYFNAEAGPQSLATVTSCEVSPDMKKGTIFVTVLPEDKEEDFIHFARRRRKDLREYLKRKTKMKILPFLDVKIDLGEKNRQRIDELSEQN